MRRGRTVLFFRPFVLGDFFIAAGVFFRGLYEPYVREVLSVKEGDVLVNAGAHIGYYVLSESGEAGESGRIVAVEPHPGTFAILARNVRANSLRNVTMVNAALSSESGEMVLLDFNNRALGTDPAFSRIASAHGVSRVGIVPVRAYSLDDLLKELGLSKVDWLVLDVEGHELAALRGAEKILRNCDVKLIVETSSADTIDFLMGLGFKRKHLWVSPSGLFGVEFFSKR